MTLPSRRKRPITPPSIRPESTPRGGDVVRRFATSAGASDGTSPRSRGDSLWLPAALLATLALLISALQALGGEPAGQLQWKRAKLPTRPVVSPTAPRSTFAPQTQNVRQVAYHDESWHAAGGSRIETESGPTLRGAYQTTQGTLSDDGASDFDRQLAEPFGGPSQTRDVPLEPTIDPRDTTLEPIDNDPNVGDLPEPRPLDGAIDPRETSVMENTTNQDATTTPRRDPFEGNRATTQPQVTPPDDTLDKPLTPPGAPSLQSQQEAEKIAAERERSEKSCNEELAKLHAKRLDAVNLSIEINGTAGRDYPFECSLHDGSMLSPRCWSQVTYMWKASAQCHKPLYFEDEALERYGHSWGPAVQPLISGAHFFSRFPVLPYCMGLTPPNECIYPLGHYRPGDCAPYMIDPVPFTWRAALWEAGAWTGGAAIVP